MRKIPTLFVRDEATNRKHVKNEVTPGCEWVLAGEGVATRKYDGTCVMFDGEDWWARREVKGNKEPPRGWVEVEHDDTTGKRVGWQPLDDYWTFWKPWTQAVEEHESWKPGTYELIGPKLNRNPEGVPLHFLIAHDTAQELDAPRDCNGLRSLLTAPTFAYEGIVWHHPDGRMAKLKKRDFPAREGV